MDPVVLEFNNGALRECAHVGPNRLVLQHHPPRLVEPLEHSRRERRHIARNGLRGRRGARRVSRLHISALVDVEVPRAIERMHWFTDGRRMVGLYLPEEQSPTPEILSMVERFLRCVGCGAPMATPFAGARCTACSCRRVDE